MGGTGPCDSSNIIFANHVYTRCYSKVPGLYKKNKKLVFFCKHFIGHLRNSPLRTEYNDYHDQEDYRMTFLGHPSVWR